MSERNASGKKLGDHLRILWKKKWLILGLLVLTCGSAVYLYTQEPERYSTTMKVQLSQTGAGLPDGSPAEEFLKGFLDTNTEFQTQLNLLRDPHVKRLMIENKIKAKPPVPEHFRNRGKEDILEELEDSIKVQDIRGTTLVEITVRGENPELLPQIATMFWDQFTELLIASLKSDMDSSLGAARRERDKAQTEYEASDQKLQEHLRRAGYNETRFQTVAEDLPDKQKSLAGRIDTLDEFITLKGDVYTGVKTALAGEGSAGLVAFYEDDVVTGEESVQELKGSIANMRRTFDDYVEENKIGPGHAVWKQFDASLTEQTRQLEALQQRILGDFVRKYEGQQKRYEQLSSDLSELNEEIDKFERVAQVYEQLKRDRDKKESRLDELNDAWGDILASMSREVMRSSGLSFPPSDPRQYYPKLFVFLGGGILLGLFLGIGLTFVLAAMDDSIRQEDEIEAALKLPCLGVVHRPDSRRGGTPAVDLASVIDPRSIFAEEFRSVRTSLGFTFDRRRGRHYSMCITSFEVQEGKTTVSSNLATVIAASGLRTLLVDADMRNGRIHRTFGLANEVGLSDVLAGEAELDAALEETEIANLSVLPSGSLYDNPAEMLESPAMRELLEELAERFDRVVFDTPPSGAVTDSKILGKQVDAAILVAATGKSRKRLLRKTIKEMLALGVRVAGVVLNEMKPGRKRYYRKYLHLYRRNTA